jgi:KTSC domain
MGYDRASQTLELEFRDGAIYRYASVPESLFQKFSRADSKGRFFTQNIRDRFAFERINAAKP